MLEMVGALTLQGEEGGREQGVYCRVLLGWVIWCGSLA